MNIKNLRCETWECKTLTIRKYGKTFEKHLNEEKKTDNLAAESMLCNHTFGVSMKMVWSPVCE